MAVQRVPQPPSTAKKTGLGCLGCGCLIVVLIFLLLAGLIGGIIYYGYHELYLVSSAQPLAIKPFTGGDAIYDGAQKKVAAFNQGVSTGQTSTLTLSADELNALTAHFLAQNPALKQMQIQALVSLQGDVMRLQGDVPSNSIPFVNMGVKDRYFDLDITTGISFNADTKEIEFDFHKVQVGDSVFPEDSLASMQASFAQNFNLRLRENKDVWNVIQVAKTITVRNGQFVIETK